MNNQECFMKKSLLKPRFTMKQIDAAVEYYLDHWQNLIGICRVLGYPNRSMLAKWIKDRFPDGCPTMKNVADEIKLMQY